MPTKKQLLEHIQTAWPPTLQNALSAPENSNWSTMPTSPSLTPHAVATTMLLAHTTALDPAHPVPLMLTRKSRIRMRKQEGASRGRALVSVLRRRTRKRGNSSRVSSLEMCLRRCWKRREWLRMGERRQGSFGLWLGDWVVVQWGLLLRIFQACWRGLWQGIVWYVQSLLVTTKKLVDVNDSGSCERRKGEECVRCLSRVTTEWQGKTSESIGAEGLQPCSWNLMDICRHGKLALKGSAICDLRLGWWVGSWHGHNC